MTVSPVRRQAGDVPTARAGISDEVRARLPANIDSASLLSPAFGLGDPSDSREVLARGFALYVGIDPADRGAAGVELREVVTALRTRLAEIVPRSDSHASVVVAESGPNETDLDVVRRVLCEPESVAQASLGHSRGPSKGLVIDLSRHRVTVDGRALQLTYNEFALLRLLVDSEGLTLARSALGEAVQLTAPADAVSDRSVDVHIRRLRAKLEPFADTVRTVWGRGYRFNRHPDVTVVDADSPEKAGHERPEHSEATDRPGDDW